MSYRVALADSGPASIAFQSPGSRLSAWQLRQGDSPENQARTQTTMGPNGAWVGALKWGVSGLLRGSTEMLEMAIIERLNSGDGLSLMVQQRMERSQPYGVPTAWLSTYCMLHEGFLPKSSLVIFTILVSQLLAFTFSREEDNESLQASGTNCLTQRKESKILVCF